MEDLLESIDQKLDLVIYCLIGFLVLAAIRTFYQIQSSIKANWRNAEADYYLDLLREQKYSALIDHADKSLKKDPNGLYSTWYKAKALYQLGQYDDARDLFDRIQIIEPDWIDAAQEYIRRIDKLNNTDGT